MAKGKRGSKNAIENRGIKTVRTCNSCGKPQKAIRLMGGRINKMIFECMCGYKDRAGKEVVV